MKQYELLKDLPCSNIGEIWTLSHDGKEYISDYNQCVKLHVDFVENNTDWFREYNPPTEQPKEDSFWNEERVKQFCNSYIGSESTNLDGYMDMFKSSRTTTPIQPSTGTVERIEDKLLLSLDNIKHCYDYPQDSPLFTALYAKLFMRAYLNSIK